MNLQEKHDKELKSFRKTMCKRTLTDCVKREGWHLLRKQVAEECQLSEAQIEEVYQTLLEKTKMWAESGRVELPGLITLNGRQSAQHTEYKRKRINNERDKEQAKL